MSTDEFLDLLADGGPCWQEYRESKSSPGGIYVYKGSEESRKHDEAWREYGRLIDAGASLDECRTGAGGGRYLGPTRRRITCRGVPSSLKQQLRWVIILRQFQNPP